MTLFIILSVMAVITVTGITRQKRRMSWPAKVIMNWYNDLPKDSQRFPGLKDKLMALDNKLGINNVNEHFSYEDYAGTPKIGWRNCHAHAHDKSGYSVSRGQSKEKCKYNVYKQLCGEIENLQKAVDKREELMLRAGIDNLGLGQLMEDIRSEREVVEIVTKELL